MPFGPGTRVGPYEIAAPLGAGGMGEVYRAHDPRLRRDVAIKVIAARVATDPDLLKRFSQEALASAALNHPNIVAVYDVGTHEGSPYLVTELLVGESLRERVSRGPLPARVVIQLGLQIVRGVTASTVPTSVTAAVVICDSRAAAGPNSCSHISQLLRRRRLVLVEGGSRS